jgi:hypothetical protein
MNMKELEPYFIDTGQKKLKADERPRIEAFDAPTSVSTDIRSADIRSQDAQVVQIVDASVQDDAFVELGEINSALDIFDRGRGGSRRSSRSRFWQYFGRRTDCR